MEKFNKISDGFVIQTFEKNDDGKFVCTEQEFIAGDSDYETLEGDPIDVPEYQYQPFNMTLD